jgi:acetyl-CoA/propionyl-CoA carboxylase biotin carboxyl carrier protein
MSTRYVVQKDQDSYRVVITPHASGYRLVIDDVEIDVDCSHIDGAAQSLLIDGRSYEVATMPSRDGLDVYVSGDVFRVRVTDELWARAEAGARDDGSGREEVPSPMPGAVVAVPVAIGQRVAAGHTVAVVEAMKMQNDVTSVRDGTVLEVRVKPGDVVDQGAVLVVLGPAEEGSGG